jgi:A/G-specific adenine glycosylase
MATAKGRERRKLARPDAGPKKITRTGSPGRPRRSRANTGVDAAGRLLEWYAATRRDLPWRETRDPYQILVSEVMLQQTRVSVVVDAYRRFVARFPTAETLAAAAADEVRAAWSGLGYYRRAERLQRAARAIVALGAVPREVAALRRLPGIGAYTAAAVASIAFGAAEPALDGNVLRVLARMTREREHPGRAAARRRLERTARALLDRERPGDSNQALMELGATVCLPARPRCDECPLAPDCRARGASPSRWPRRAPARSRERQRWLLLVVEEDGFVWLARRPDDAGFLAGRWLLPWADASAGEAAALAEAGDRCGVRFSLDDGARARVRHAITFRDIAATVARARLAGPASGGDTGWFTREEIAALPTSSLVGKALRALERAEREAATRSRLNR